MKTRLSLIGLNILYIGNRRTTGTSLVYEEEDKTKSSIIGKMSVKGRELHIHEKTLMLSIDEYNSHFMPLRPKIQKE